MDIHNTDQNVSFLQPADGGRTAAAGGNAGGGQGVPFLF